MTVAEEPRWVERDTPDWIGIWKALGAALVTNHLGDGSDIIQEHDGECWQYMGTYAGKHSFRHRCHPVTCERVNLSLNET